MCSIAFHPHAEHIFAHGSYDQTVHCWDIRSMASPLSSVDTGGGVWRLKWHPSEERKVTLSAVLPVACNAVIECDLTPPSFAAGAVVGRLHACRLQNTGYSRFVLQRDHDGTLCIQRTLIAGVWCRLAPITRW